MWFGHGEGYETKVGTDGGLVRRLVRDMNRRRFLQQSLAASTVFSAPAILRARSPNSMFQVASIGVGGDGRQYDDECAAACEGARGGDV